MINASTERLREENAFEGCCKQARWPLALAHHQSLIRISSALY